MKTFNSIVKILTALAAVAGAVYIVATYGDRIVAWAKKLLAKCPCHCTCNIVMDNSEADETAEETETDVTNAPDAEETPVEETPAEQTDTAEAPVEPIVIEQNEPVAEDADFEA